LDTESWIPLAPVLGVPLSGPVLEVPVLSWLVLAGEPGKSDVGVNVELLWGKAGLERLDEVTSSFDGLIWLSDSGPLSDDDVLADVGSGSISVGEDKVSHLGVSDGLSSLIVEPKFSPLLTDVGELDDLASSFLLL